MAEICNSKFWDGDELLNSTSPDLTECFQQTALSWTPCIYMILVTGPYIWHLRSQKQFNQYTALSIAKLVFSSLLVCICALDVSAAIYWLIMGEISHVSSLVSSISQLIAMVLCIALIETGRRHGERLSAVLFVYWILQLIVVIFILQSRARKFSASEKSIQSFSPVYEYSGREDGWYSTVWSGLFVVLVLVQLIMSSVVDKEYLCCPNAAFGDMKNSPELCASMFSVISFWWVTRLMMIGYKKDLMRTDIWDLKPSERSHTIVPQFMKHWRRQILQCCKLSSTSISLDQVPEKLEKSKSVTIIDPSLEKRAEDDPGSNVVERTSKHRTENQLSESDIKSKSESVKLAEAESDLSEKYRELNVLVKSSTSSDEERVSCDSLCHLNAKQGSRCERGELQARGDITCPKLWLALCKTFWKKFLLGALFKFIHDIFQFLNPLLLERMIDFINIPSQPVWLGYCYAVFLFVVAFIQSVMLHQYFHHCMTVGLCIRTALISAIYEKSLRLSNSSRRESDTGEVVNLMAVDAQRFLELTTYLNTLWSGPLQILITLFLLYMILGPSVFAGLFIMLLLIPINAVITKFIRAVHAQQMKLKDARIRLINEVLTGIKVLKLYAWETSFEDKINNIREQELRLLRKSAYLQSLSTFAFLCAPFMVSLVTFAVYILSSPDNVFDAKKAFVSISLFNILRFPLLMFPAVIVNIAQVKVSIKRIQKFLLSDELDETSVKRSATDDLDAAVVISEGTFAWDLPKPPAAASKSPSKRKGCCRKSDDKNKNKNNQKSRESEGLLNTDHDNKSETRVLNKVYVHDADVERQKSLVDDLKNENNSSASKAADTERSGSVKEGLEKSGAESSTTREQIQERNFNVALYGVDLTLRRGSLTAVIGQVGSGKSSLVSALLREMIKMSGSVSLKGRVAYVAQQSWIQNGTVEMNILFGREKNDSCYQSVIQACALTPDLNILHAGDQTEIGEKGINLSGGQKQRISLARAVYSQADVYLLDDPLSAVDAHVGKQIFDQVISHSGLLCGKTRLLITHGLRYLPLVDEIVVMENGRIAEIGCYSDLLKSKGPFTRFLRVYLEQQSRASVLVQHDALDCDMCDDLSSAVEDDDELSKVVDTLRSKSVDKKEIPTTALVTGDLSASKPGGREEGRGGGCEERGLRCRVAQGESSETRMYKKGRKSEGPPTRQEEMASGRVSLAVFKLYMGSVGATFCVFIIFAHIINSSLSVGANFWLSDWSNDGPSNDTTLRDTRLGVYGALGVGQSLALVCATFLLAFGCLRAAGYLHRILLWTVLRLPMIFFDLTPGGRIMNRFSGDIDVLDITLPLTLQSLLVCLFQAVATVIVIAISVPWFLLTITPLTVFYFVIQRLYVRTSRQLRRLESVSRSPIFSHFGETLVGAATIRAYRADRRFIRESERRLDDNQACYYATLVTNRWLALRLEFIGNCVVFFAALFAVIGREHLSPGIVGLSITYALSITQVLNWLVRMSTELETNIVSVERIKEYTEVEREAEWVIEDHRPHKKWPERGEIRFIDYTSHYRTDLDPVLVNITCEIKGGEKVGVVGRTGAGKSSMTLAMLRIIEAHSGQIFIDDIDISTIGLHDLRSCITIIPQDPILFSGTVRMNLDPFSRHSDEELWTALEGAHLKSFILSLPHRLDHECSEGGENLSVGQRQLVCMARALLRRSRVLILDEATAAVDVETDDLIQKTIRSEFSHCTIITIAHRINTIMDYDRIIVLDKGVLKELESPQTLLADKSSLFYSLALHAGLVV